MLPGQRKSVEPMAARVHPQDVRSAVSIPPNRRLVADCLPLVHQSMHHLVADSAWSDTALLAAEASEAVPMLSDEERHPVSGLSMTRAVANTAHIQSAWRANIAGNWARQTTARWR